MKAKLLFIHSLSPVHAGTGQGVGVIDQPIAREKATNIPYIPGSSVKGVFRDACTGTDCEKIFGPKTDNADAFAGSVTISDARLLLLPVRSLSGVFAWVTSPFILHRLIRDLKEITFDKNPPTDVPMVGQEACLVCIDESPLKTKPTMVVLEDLPLNCTTSPVLKDWGEWLGEQLFVKNTYWQNSLIEKLCLVSDDVFSFLLEIGTQITARIRIDDKTKTAAGQAFWYEEALPAETILSSLVVATNVQAKPETVFKTLADISQASLQFGGSATIGQGLCLTRLVPQEAS